MNPLRALVDWLRRRREPIDHARDAARDVTMDPLAPEWRDVMGRCGADCHVRDHRDALQRLGQLTLQLGVLERRLRLAERDRDEAVSGMADALRSRDVWRERALRAEGKLSHPSSGERAA